MIDETVPEGFQKTEVGIIPNDWSVSTVGNEFDIKLGKMLDSEKNFGVPKLYLGNKSVQWNRIDTTDLQVMLIPQNELERFRLKFGDLLVCEGGEVGRAAIWENQIEECYFQKALHRLRPKSEFNTRLMLALFHYWSAHNKLSEYVSQTSIAHLTREKLLVVPLPVPPKDEQTAIANALNDADELITKLEKLIAKKRNIKQGAMQELLKPKDDWEVKKLGEICSRITTGRLDANAMKPDGQYRFYTCAKDYYFIDRYAFDDEALLISGNGENVGYVHYFKGKFNAYQRTYVLTGFNQDIKYLKKYLDKYLGLRIEVEVNAGNTPYIKMGTLTEMDIYFPKSKTEQTRIARILSDMDAEIEALEKKLAKYKMLKQGMMQNLLTGKIRLVAEARTK